MTFQTLLGTVKSGCLDPIPSYDTSNYQSYKKRSSGKLSPLGEHGRSQRDHAGKEERWGGGARRRDGVVTARRRGRIGDRRYDDARNVDVGDTCCCHYRFKPQLCRSDGERRDRFELLDGNFCGAFAFAVAVVGTSAPNKGGHFIISNQRVSDTCLPGPEINFTYGFARRQIATTTAISGVFKSHVQLNRSRSIAACCSIFEVRCCARRGGASGISSFGRTRSGT